MKRFLRFCITFVITFMLGALFHFAFDWLGQPTILKVIFPSNESIFEHTKIILFPMLLVLSRSYDDCNIESVGIASVLSTIFMPLIYYFLAFGCHIEGLPIDLANMAFVMILGMLLIPILDSILPLDTLKGLRVLDVIIILFVVVVIVLSFVHPQISFFMDSTMPGWSY